MHVFVIHWDEGLRKRMKHIHQNQINWDVFDSSLGMSSTDGGGQCRSRVYAKKIDFRVRLDRRGVQLIWKRSLRSRAAHHNGRQFLRQLHVYRRQLHDESRKANGGWL